MPRQRTIHWVVEQLLTHKELHSPPDTPGEWWEVPVQPPLKNEEEALAFEAGWNRLYPTRATRIVKIVELRAYKIKGEWANP